MNFQEVLEKITGPEEIAFAGKEMSVSELAPDQNHWLNFAKWSVLAVNYGKYRESHLLLKTLNGLLRAGDEASQLIYEPILVWLNYAAFDDLSQGEVEDFFKERNFVLLFREKDYLDLLNKTKLWLLSWLITERNALRERIYNGMRGNDSLLTGSFITADRGTIKNWLKEYDKAVGFDLADPLDRIEFENQSAISAHLSVEDKGILKKLFDFYEYIKLSSTSLEGFEDDIIMDVAGNTYLYANEKEFLATPTADKKDIGSLTASIKKETIGIFLPPLPDIIKQSQSYLLSTNGEISKVIAELQKNLGSGNVLGATGALLLLAQLRILDDALGSDQNLQALVRDDLKKSGLDDKVEGLRLNPTAPNFIARFLKIALQDKLNIAEAEALDFSQKLAGLLALEGEKYSRIVVTGENGKLKWNL